MRSFHFKPRLSTICCIHFALGLNTLIVELERCKHELEECREDYATDLDVFDLVQLLTIARWCELQWNERLQAATADMVQLLEQSTSSTVPAFAQAMIAGNFAPVFAVEQLESEVR